MRMFNSPRPGRCASCEGQITGRPVYRMDEAYCCVGCVVGGPCVCNYEADLADDGVDGVGLPFALDAVPSERTPASEPAPEAMPARSTSPHESLVGRDADGRLATELVR